jgi:hypothetical protein
MEVGAKVRKLTKSLRRAAFAGALGSVAIMILWTGVPAAAFMASDEQQFAADISEAKARAHDFQKTLDRISEQEKERESSAYLMHEERLRDDDATDSSRREFVRERNNRPSEDEERERLEIADDKLKEKDAEVMEAYRRQYIEKRNQVRAIIDRDAFIDETKEYGL